MLYNYDVIEVSEVERNDILKCHNVTMKEFEEMVDIIEKWMVQSDLPKEDCTRRKIEIMLFNSKLNMEKSKRCLESYYRVRTEHSDFFDKFIPNSSLYNEAKKISKPITMPKLTPDLCRLIVFRLEKYEELQCGAEFYQMLPMMANEVRLSKGDCFYSQILIVDLSFFELRHLLKYTPTICTFYIKLLLAISLRLKNIHIVNPPSFIDKVVSFLKLFLPNKFHEKIMVHSNYESLYKLIPKEYLPLDYGGTQLSIKEIQDKWCEEFEKNEALFKKLLDVKCQSPKIVNESTNHSFGLNGTFRKLSVD